MLALLAAAVLAAEAPLVDPVTVVVCPLDDACEPDADWAAATLGGAVARLDLVLERDNGGWDGGVDTRAALAGALDRAEAAVAKARWAEARAAIDAAKEALGRVRGDVSGRALFRLWFLDGAVAVARGEARAHEYAFRQAAAIVQGVEVALPPHPEAAARAWADERRKLAVGGTGTLTLAADPDVAWSIDGNPVASGAHALYPGNHRVVAVRPGTVRSWQAEVPVLAGRTVPVAATFAPSDSAVWQQARLREAFDTLQGPPELTRLLSGWAARHGLARVRLALVERPEPAAAPAPPAPGPTDPSRPAAADGERVDHGDGIPSTYAEEVLAVAEAAPAPALAGPRLRVLWYDPALERFSADLAPPPRPDTDPARLRIGLQLGYVGMMDRPHAAGDLVAAYDLGLASLPGRLALEARLGLVRADAPYALYPGWADRQLYHLALAGRWAARGDVAPYVALGPELYVPVAVGARLAAGVDVHVARWIVTAELSGAWADTGPGWGAGVGIARSY